MNAKKQYLETDEGKKLNTEICKFVKDNAYSKQAVSFAKEAVKAVMEGEEVDFESKIVITKNVPICLKNIINRLKSNSKNVNILPHIAVDFNLSSFILNTFNNNSKHQLMVDVKNLGTQRNARTTPKSTEGNNFLYIIEVNSLFLKNATDLAIARTMIHESLHAYLSFLYQTEPLSDLSFSLSYHLSQNGYNINMAQHQLMVENFIQAISYSLQEWDNNRLNGFSYYNYLGWSGEMLNTTEFKN